MLFRTHLSFALLLGLLTFNFFELNWILYFILILLSTLFIDIDTPKSFLGSKIKLISFPLRFLFGHRNFIHSLLFLVLTSFFIWVFFDFYFVPFFIGGVSHLFLDGLTKQGVNFLYPWKFSVKGFIKTGGFFEGILFFIFNLLNLIFIVNMFV